MAYLEQSLSGGVRCGRRASFERHRLAVLAAREGFPLAITYEPGAARANNVNGVLAFPIWISYKMPAQEGTTKFT